MNGCPLKFAGYDFIALGSGALLWPAQNALIVADLHLGKSCRIARRGGALLPPFETQDTLQRLLSAVKTTGAERLFMLGDVFDDDAARATLSAGESLIWRRILNETDCVVLAGNHDPAGAPEIILSGIGLRHIASTGPDISGHYHPKAHLKGTTRPAFLIGKDHLILPAFGTFTGGLSVDTPVLSTLVGAGLVVLTGPRPLAFPFNKRSPLRTH